MAFPSRLKSVFRPIAKVAKVVTPTGIGVLLSIGAHAALLTYGPRTNFSFAALSRAAQEADAEETIVPLVTLSPAERNRLPSFAQPRQPPRTTGLSSLALPSGILDIPTSRAFKNRPVPAKPLPAPSATTPSKPVGPLGGTLPSGIRPTPFPLNFPITSLPKPARPQAPAVAVVPDPPSLPTPDPSAGDPGQTDRFNSEIPVLPGGVILPSDRSFSDALEGTQQASINTNPIPANEPDPAEPKPVEPSVEGAEEETGAIAIPVEPQVIATAPAQGDPRLLSASNVYDEREVSEEEAAEKTQEWLVATAKGKGTVATANAEITIDSGFKACRDVPPQDGRIGVVVNPDGSQEDITVLKSIGYDVLNRLALSTLEYEEFEQPKVPTQYQVEVKVEYKPEGCVEEMPDAPSELPQIGN